MAGPGAGEMGLLPSAPQRRRRGGDGQVGRGGAGARAARGGGRGRQGGGREERRGLQGSAETVSVKSAAGRTGIQGGLVRREPRSQTAGGGHLEGGQRQGGFQHAPSAGPRPAASPGRHADLPGSPARALRCHSACGPTPADLALAQPAHLPSRIPLCQGSGRCCGEWRTGGVRWLGIPLSITHRRAMAQAVSPDSRLGMLSNQERRQPQQAAGGGGGGGGGVGVLTWETGHTWVSAKPLSSPVSQ